MAEAAVKLGLKSVPYVTDNYEKVWDPAKDRASKGFRVIKKKVKNRNGEWEETSDYSDDDGGPRSRAYSNGRRSGSRTRSGRGDVVEERRAYRSSNGRARSTGREERDYRRRKSTRDYSSSSSPSPPRRSKSKRRQSLGERAMAALGLGAAGGAVASGRRRSYSSSRSRSRSRDRSRRRRRSPNDGDYRSNRETAVAPYSRGYDDDRTPARYRPSGYTENGRERNDDRSRGAADSGHGEGSQLMVRDKSTTVGGKSSKRSSSKSSSSSSDVCSSSEDERRIRKGRGKEFVTAGLAAVATIHAAHGVYSSMEARDKRAMEVLKGELSPEEARKKKNKARLQDAAAIGIAALGIKGAYSEWQEVQEKRHEMEELKKEREERHEKRVRKAEKHGYYYNDRGRGDSRTDLRKGRNRSA